ncbi:hypothetical protein HDU67_008245 [Dinochytrium kinnereticum]|nr:hypothetical protein HDU67_008245 [Dinochytrium kinnereticum]
MSLLLSPFSSPPPTPSCGQGTPDDGTDTDGSGALKLGLGLFIITGLLVSYLPQFLKIIKSKTSLGLSVWFLFLGSFGNVAIVVNVTIQQADTSTMWSCIQNTLGFTQIFIQFLCFHYLIFLFYIYFPERPELPRSEDPEYKHALQVLRYMIYWMVVNAVVLVACLVLRLEMLTWTVMAVLGAISLVTTFVQYLPQIAKTVESRSPGALSVLTLIMQCPGNIILVYSISLQPGTNWTSWVAFLASGIFQFILLSLCVFFMLSAPRDGYVRIEDGPPGSPPFIPDERTPLILGDGGIVVEEDVRSG